MSQRKKLAKNKLKKFLQLEEYLHVKQPSLEELKQGYVLKGKWKQDFFQNQNPIVLELGCGKGEYAFSLAKKYPKKNFIGVDIKGARIWKGATDSLNDNMINVGFLRIRIDWIESCFAKEEIDEIWITFPDPQIKKRRANKRLTHPNFLKRYQNILQKRGRIHLKTDSQFLHQFTLDVITEEGHLLHDSSNDIYNDKKSREHMDIKTHYEKLHLEKDLPITYLSFSLK